MKKFVKNIALFVPVFVIFYCVVICLLGEFAPYRFRDIVNYRLGANGYLHSKIREIKEFKNVDILFVGTSHAYRGFDVRIFQKHGYKTFNLGSSIQTPIQTNLLLERYLEELNPKLVVYDVNPDIFGNDGVESSLDLISNDRIGFDTFEMAFNLNNVHTYNTLIFSYYKQITDADKKYKEDEIKGEDTYISGGFVQKKLKRFTSEKHYPKEKYSLDSMQLDCFDKNIKLLKSRKIPYVLVHMPMTKKLYQSKKNHAEITKLMTQKFKSRYYDFNQLLQLNDSLFYDDNHLNQLGVQVFDSVFIAKMKQDGILPK